MNVLQGEVKKNGSGFGAGMSCNDVSNLSTWRGMATAIPDIHDTLRTA
jgi:hypothetical protein